MLAFAKVPRAALATRALPVLFDLREEIFATEAFKMEKGVPGIFRDKATAVLKRNEVEVLSWKTDQTSINRLVNGAVFGSFCPLHPFKREFGSLDVLSGRFLMASPDKLDEKAVLRSLVPDGLLRPMRYITATKGCGCSMGRLGNPYRAGAADKGIRWWMAIEDDSAMLQIARCQWRYDLWLSEEPLGDVGTVDDGDADLSCEVSLVSTKLLVPVEDLSRLVYTAGVGRNFPDSTLLYSTSRAKVGPAGPPQAIDEEGCNFAASFQVWSEPPAAAPAPQLPEREADKPDVVADFQEHLGAVLCSPRCAFSDLQDVPQALGHILSLPSPPIPRPRFVTHKRGTSKPCDHVQKMLMPLGFPKDLASFTRDGLGPLTTKEEIAGIEEGLFGRIEEVYREDCDFEATLLLAPAPCEEGYMPDLHLMPSGIVEETCVTPAVAGTGVAPLYRYAVTWDLHHHDEDKLRKEEQEVEDGLRDAGFSRWGQAMLLSSPKLNTDTFWWRRSLRQRIFVQRDPRVTTASGDEVCSKTIVG
jgi:hypothetical protein